MSHRTAVLWTGGKDSSLAFYEASLQGYTITDLVTFAPKNPEFIAHPINLMKLQAEAIGLNHRIMEIQEPYEESYKKAIELLNNDLEITTLITGDIAEVNGQPNWISECCKNTDIEVVMPLWHCTRETIIQTLIDHDFHIVFSYLKKPWFNLDWVGKKLNFDSLQSLRQICLKDGIDLCGEQGEYHTITLDAPFFLKQIHLDNTTKKENENCVYIDIQALSLMNKKLPNVVS